MICPLSYSTFPSPLKSFHQKTTKHQLPNQIFSLSSGCIRLSVLSDTVPQHYSLLKELGSQSTLSRYRRHTLQMPARNHAGHLDVLLESKPYHLLLSYFQKGEPGAHQKSLLRFFLAPHSTNSQLFVTWCTLSSRSEQSHTPSSPRFFRFICTLPRGPTLVFLVASTASTLFL